MLVQGGIKYIEQIKKIKSMNLQLEHYIVDFAKILLQTIGAKDHYTEEHSRRVTLLCIAFANYLNISKKEISDLQIAAAFHDIGKIGIPDSILLKTTRLTDDEYQIIKTHPVIAANIFSVSDIYKDIYPIMYYHHERYEGNGYPTGIKGKEIPFLARILTICDSFDAIVSKRTYKEGATIEFALTEIEKGNGTQFDPELAPKFITMVNNNREYIDKIYTEF